MNGETTHHQNEGSEPRMLFTIRSVSEEVEKEINSFVLDNGLNENKQLVNTKRNDDLGEGHRIQKPIPKPRKSLVQTHDLDITRFRNNDNHNSISNTLALQTIRRKLCPDWVSKLGSPPSEIAHFINGINWNDSERLLIGVMPEFMS